MNATWDLGFERIEDGEHAWVPVRPATEEEVARLNDAHTDLRLWMIESPFSKLNADYLAFVQAMTNTARRAGATGHLDPRELVSTLVNWLSSLRGFDDKTSHLVSAAHGKESDEYTAWKATLRHEFDTDFSYRFCYKLRNFAQHVQDPMQHLSFTSSEAPGGGIDVALRMEFDPPVLLERYREWGSVRKDLEGLGDSRIDIPTTVIRAMASCTRALQRLVVAESPRIEGACDVIESVAGEIPLPGSIPMYMKFEPNPDQTMSVRLVAVRPDAAELARALLARCRAELSDASGRGGAAHLT